MPVKLIWGDADLDTDRDGSFISYLTKLFDTMATTTIHKCAITKEEVMYATGVHNRVRTLSIQPAGTLPFLLDFTAMTYVDVWDYIFYNLK